jgi:hypothetical protein
MNAKLLYTPTETNQSARKNAYTYSEFISASKASLTTCMDILLIPLHHGNISCRDCDSLLSVSSTRFQTASGSIGSSK